MHHQRSVSQGSFQVGQEHNADGLGPALCAIICAPTPDVETALSCFLFNGTGGVRSEYSRCRVGMYVHEVTKFCVSEFYLSPTVSQESIDDVYIDQ